MSSIAKTGASAVRNTCANSKRFLRTPSRPSKKTSIFCCNVSKPADSIRSSSSISLLTRSDTRSCVSSFLASKTGRLIMAASENGPSTSGNTMRDTVVFLGPSLAREEAEQILDADYLPPICKGDLAKLPEHVRFVGIVDGEFYQSLSVSPKEILKLLRRGVTVLGASSMGALRAAETWKLGTIGVGRIFEMFRDGILDADDEVALIYERDTYRNLSTPLVNLRAALDMAAANGVIDEQEKTDLLLKMKSRYFPDRSHHALQSLCPKLRDYFRTASLPDIKRDDALELLHTLRNVRDAKAPVSERTPLEILSSP